MFEDLLEGFAAGLDFIRGRRASRRQMNRRSLCADRCAGSCRQLRQPGGDTVNKGGHAHFARQSIEQLVDDIDGQLTRPIFGDERFGTAARFDLGRAGSTKLVCLRLGLRQKR